MSNLIGSVRHFLWLVCASILIAAVPVGASAFAEGDCFSSLDAPNTYASGLAVAAPLRCVGHLTASTDTGDVYTFQVSADSDLRVGVRPLDGHGAFACIKAPSAPVAGGWICDDVFALWEHRDPSPEPGWWMVRVENDASLAYELSVTLNVSSGSGTQWVGSPVGVDETLGPDAAIGLDGAWWGLPATADGNETARFSASTGFVVIGVEFGFFDAALERIEGGSCTSEFAPQVCGVPSGAAWVHVKAECCVKVEWTIEYFH